MSVETVFTQLKTITVKPVQARHHDGIGIFSVQRILFQFEDGSTHQWVLHLETGLHSLTVGELVTNAQVTV
ncbi:MAG: hypothetical protein ABI171_14140 [Collimonas sp.]|uniref:hypothetical protein n=1 Tax=Collimonas sp. TaxID=1963772 RepID=UPI003267D50E